MKIYVTGLFSNGVITELQTEVEDRGMAIHDAIQHSINRLRWIVRQCEKCTCNVYSGNAYEICVDNFITQIKSKHDKEQTRPYYELYANGDFKNVY